MKTLLVLTGIVTMSLIHPLASLNGPAGGNCDSDLEKALCAVGNESGGVDVQVTEESMEARNGSSSSGNGSGVSEPVGRRRAPLLTSYDKTCMEALAIVDSTGFLPLAEPYRRCFVLKRDPSDDDPGGAADVTVREVIRSQLGSINVESAGLATQPAGRAFIGLPQLAHAKTPKHTRTINLLGNDIEVQVVASQFSFDFMDGSDPIVTTDPGGPWPNTSIQHTYDTPNPKQTVKLTTKWDVIIKSPYTGRIIKLPNALTSKEESAPFDLRKPRSVNTDHAEKEQGH